MWHASSLFTCFFKQLFYIGFNAAVRMYINQAGLRSYINVTQDRGGSFIIGALLFPAEWLLTASESEAFGF